MVKKNNKNKSRLREIDLIGKEFRTRIFGMIAGVICMALSVYGYIVFNSNVSPDWGFVESIGGFIILLVLISAFAFGFLLVIISFMDRGFNEDD